jgi:hypothetical protein
MSAGALCIDTSKKKEDVNNSDGIGKQHLAAAFGVIHRNNH